MNTNGIKTAELLNTVSKMTNEQIDLLNQIMELVAGRPDRKQFAMEYTGKMADLPAALAKI